MWYKKQKEPFFSGGLSNRDVLMYCTHFEEQYKLMRCTLESSSRLKCLVSWQTTVCHSTALIACVLTRLLLGHMRCSVSPLALGRGNWCWFFNCMNSAVRKGTGDAMLQFLCQSWLSFFDFHLQKWIFIFTWGGGEKSVPGFCWIVNSW